MVEDSSQQFFIIGREKPNAPPKKNKSSGYFKIFIFKLKQVNTN
jgi:hypothetical protein